MFDAKYQVVVADTPAALRIHHQIRYQVYCVEQGYEDPAQFPDHEERDQWDPHAVHFLVRERSSGEYIGAMRLIKPVNGVLPIQRAAQLEPGAIPADARTTAWELSRTCILSEYRRGRSGRRNSANASDPDPAASRDQASAFVQPFTPKSRLRHRINWVAMEKLRSAHLTAVAAGGGERRRVTPRGSSALPPSGQDAVRVNGYEILAGMLRAAIEYTRDHNVYHLYFLINRALARMVRRMEFDIIKAGPAIEHRGVRHPYVADLNELVFGAVMRSPEMAKLFLEGEDPYRNHSAIERQALLSCPSRTVAAA